MSKLDQHRIEHPGRDADKELRDLQRRFTAISRRHDRATANRKFLGSPRATLLFALVTAGVAFLIGSVLL
ncbi:MAG: hypothetical protein ABS59_02735 [Methylobacterium sp. SCN 67-24]|nr:MAG: hypothetical protein ABS59_02735 [Methylobacterium sp. SCN 67-24]